MMWAVNTAAGVALLLLLVVRKNYRVYPAFTFYIFVNVAVAGRLQSFCFGSFAAVTQWFRYNKHAALPGQPI